jgi:hypothetical protein
MGSINIGEHDAIVFDEKVIQDSGAMEYFQHCPSKKLCLLLAYSKHSM